jgi:polyribonucleotide nucleotidyltransferase
VHHTVAATLSARSRERAFLKRLGEFPDLRTVMKNGESRAALHADAPTLSPFFIPDVRCLSCRNRQHDAGRKERDMSIEQPGTFQGTHNSEKFHTISVDVGDTPIIFEVGRLAKQAAGAVWVRWGDSALLSTVCLSTLRMELDFFPLTVEYIEKTYATGKIPGGFFKREAQPRGQEILNARLTDRSIRPLFPAGYKNDTQVINTVMSHDEDHETDVLALCASSMAIHVSEIPYAEESGPIAGVRVCRVNGKLIAYPTVSQRAVSDIDLIVTVSKDAIVMVEGGAAEASEDDIVDALFFAHAAGQKVIDAIHEMRKVMGKEKIAFVRPQPNQELVDMVRSLAKEKGLAEAIFVPVKKARYAAIDKIKEETIAAIKTKLGDEAFAAVKKELSGYFSAYKAEVVRQRVTTEQRRIDGRKPADIRPICVETSVLARTHGSACFTRGETQAICSVTLGSSDDEQKIDGLLGVTYRRFMLHYNFPPFCTGEAKPLRGQSRREIGHGALAERAVKGVAPNEADFPYTIRVVSEVTESNGSSSMASVCGSSLALMDAGVPITAPVAGIAMGLVKEGDKFAILSDILGDEDALGDMDFKVCGTAKGVNAIQMDIKIAGLSRDIMKAALDQARDGRLHILKEMTKALDKPRTEMSRFAPVITSIRINPDKIRDIIGPGGKTIRDIVARTGAKIDVEDDGTVKIFAIGKDSGDRAKAIIDDLTREPEVNRIYKGLVRKVVDFGAFVEIFPGTDGLIHISELSDKRVASVSDVVQEGDEVNVKVLSIDRDGKIRLSRRQAQGHEAGAVVVNTD